MLDLPMLLGAFQPRARTGRPAAVFPRDENQELPSILVCVSQQILLTGFDRLKAPSSMGKSSTAEVLRLRATSSVSRNQSIRRFARDDGFVGERTERRPLCGSRSALQVLPLRSHGTPGLAG